MGHRGKFISFEGPDGAGKTSVLTAIQARLAPKLGKRLIVTREPGGDPIAEQIRAVILDRKNQAMDVRTEALLYAASRRQHVVSTILPALENGQLVLCDRFVDSSIAYQGAGRKIGEQSIAEINHFATQGLLPAKTIYFDIPVSMGLKRIAQHRDTKKIDRLDVETVDFHERVHAGYDRLIKQNPDRYVVIDASQELDVVVEEVLSAIKVVTPEYFD
ncbi:dTMP kinase [Lentilactobacillus senioris]|uniref:dTMP kinase n=1 Tax=Lentilactobacillus senioris TaxID=931534 RepID=UPI0022831B6B|nr:dTMP kinase [Lentilactobacillus senioris]MCY9807163.1 dTMP kinase [Lentilactobacillus senioris]